jgi:uncharacterized glyoxalase superfamily protein PhnB
VGPAKQAVDVGIVARNADVLVAFYRDVLGLEYVEAFDTRIGRIHRLRFGGSWVKIVEGDSTEPVVPHTFAEPGMRYLTFEITDVDDVWQRLLNSGAAVVAPLQEHAGTGAKAGSVSDPEGNVIELLTRRTA